MFLSLTYYALFLYCFFHLLAFHPAISKIHKDLLTAQRDKNAKALIAAEEEQLAKTRGRVAPVRKLKAFKQPKAKVEKSSKPFSRNVMVSAVEYVAPEFSCSESNNDDGAFDLSVAFMITAQVQVSQWCIEKHLNPLRRALNSKESWLELIENPRMFEYINYDDLEVIERCAKIADKRNRMIHDGLLFGYSQNMNKSQIDLVRNVVGSVAGQPLKGDFLFDLMRLNTAAPKELISTTVMASCPSPKEATMTVLMLSLDSICEQQAKLDNLSEDLKAYCLILHYARRPYAHPSVSNGTAQALLQILPRDGYIVPQ